MVSIEAREKHWAAAAGRSFLPGRYRGVGSSLHERAPLFQPHSALLLPPLFTQGLTLSGGREHRKRGITLFSLCTPHNYTSAPKASTNELASAEREVGL